MMLLTAQGKRYGGNAQVTMNGKPLQRPEAEEMDALIALDVL